MTRSVHICVASDPPVLSSFGGAIQRRVWELARHQASLGHHPIAYSVGPRRRTIHKDGAMIEYIPTLKTGPARHLEFLTKVFAIEFANRETTVYNVHSEPEAVLGAKLLRAPSLLFYDNFVFRRGRLRSAYSRMLRGFDVLAPCSTYCANESIRYWGLDDKRNSMTVVHNGVDLVHFRPDKAAGEARRQLLGLEGRVILYVGRVTTQKGTDVLLDAFNMMDRSDCTLLIAGPIDQFSGSSSDMEDAWATRMKRPRVRYLGPLAEQDLAATYNAADVFVMPTRQLEMFGMAAVEAQSCGLPVIASDHGGLRETVPLEVGGRFPVGDASELANRLLRLLDDPEALDACSQEARRNAERFGWQRIVRQLDRVYDRLGLTIAEQFATE